MHKFSLYRHRDVSQVSGTGVVAEGVLFTDGSVAIRWLGYGASTAVWADLDTAMKVHGHDGATEVVWETSEEELTAAKAQSWRDCVFWFAAQQKADRISEETLAKACESNPYGRLPA
jgi:hypothetical protein